jgi:enoyl-CoA hydratase
VSDVVTSSRRDDVWVITVDDGKANALSPAVIDTINHSLDDAEDAGAKAILFAGRPDMLSGGFDLSIMRGTELAAVADLVTLGGELMLRLYSSPTPVVCACTGHAVAAGALLLLASHHRVGAEGVFRIGLIEGAIGMVLPDWAVVLAGERLSRRHLQQATIEARVYQPAEAMDAGFLDRVAPAGAAVEAAFEEATRLAALPGQAYEGNALKLRGDGVAKLREILTRDRKQADELRKS